MPASHFEKPSHADQANITKPLTHLEFQITEKEFELFRILIYKLVGIQLNDNKKMLVISRLSRRLRALNLTNFSQYYEYIVGSSQGSEELINLVNQITTNKTDFFRESHHFDFLAQRFLPAFLESGSTNLRIWSAGCSTGEEPYTLAMTVLVALENKRLRTKDRDIKILATDVDTNVLDKARTGVYRKAALAEIPAAYQSRFFSEYGPEQIAVKPALQELISFRRFNLMHDFPFNYGFDIIFCRNVLIYFSQEDRFKIVRKFQDTIRPRGFLMLGHSESLLADNCGFHHTGNTVYRKD